MQLSIEQLKFGFNDFQIDIDSFNLPTGKHFIMGPNGSGKTTLLKLIAGIYRQDSGYIRLDGNAAGNVPPWKRHVAYIPQDLLLFPNLTVEKNLLFSVAHGDGRMEIFRDIIEELDIKNILKHKPHEISGGESQRVAFARSVISAPRLLLMDEPLSMQDQKARSSILSKLDDFMQKYSFSVIYVTHDQSDMDFGYDSITFIHKGKIVETVNSLDRVKNVHSRTMLNYGNIIQIGHDFYAVNEDAVTFSDKPGYVYRAWKSYIYHVFSVTIDSKEFFLKLSIDPDGKYINFKPEKLDRLSM